MALKLKIFEIYFFGTNLGTMQDKFMEEKSQFSIFCFWQLTTCQTTVRGKYYYIITIRCSVCGAGTQRIILLIGGGQKIFMFIHDHGRLSRLLLFNLTMIAAVVHYCLFVCFHCLKKINTLQSELFEQGHSIVFSKK